MVFDKNQQKVFYGAEAMERALTFCAEQRLGRKKQRNKLLEVAVSFNIRSSELALITHSYLKSKKKSNKKYFEYKFVFIKLSMASQNFIRSSMKSAVLSVLLFSKFLPIIKTFLF